jgi:hypothetical protein
VFITKSAVDYLIGTINIPLSSGNTTSAPTINLLQQSQLPNVQVDNNGNPYLLLQDGEVLKMKVTVATGGATIVYVNTFGMDF